LAERDPYEAARTKMEMSRVLGSGTDADYGVALLREARESFQRLGAHWDLAATEGNR